jgi:N-acyl-L-homoserine lactone synthetase
MVAQKRLVDRSSHLSPTRGGGRIGQAPYAYAAQPLGSHQLAALDAAYRLRQAVFAHELGWVAPGGAGRERDRCDARAQHFAVFTRRAGDHAHARTGPLLVAYARVLLPEQGLMLEREFAALLAGEPLQTNATHAFEVSRLVVHPSHRGRLGADRRSAVEHLGRAIARWALARGRTEWLSVCEVRHVRALRLRGLPFSRFGSVVEYQPGVPVCATRLDLPSASAHLRTCRPGDYAWYIEGAGLQ